jgi:hypothetical protein
MITEPSFVDDHLANLLARTSYLISREFHAVVEASGLALIERRVMASLSCNDSLSINHVASIVLAKKQTVTKLVGNMQDFGRVKRCVAAHH